MQCTSRLNQTKSTHQINNKINQNQPKINEKLIKTEN